MSISLRFSLLFGLVILVMGSLAGLTTAAREYGIQLDMASSRTESRLLGHPGLQFFIYQSNGEQLQAELTEFLRDDSSILAQAYNGLGDKLAQVQSAGASNIKPAIFSLVRSSLLAGDTGLISFASDTGAPMDNGFWSALFDQRAPIYQSLPVFTEANTGRSGLTAADFALAITSSSDLASQRIVGYLHILHSRGALLDTALNAGLRVFFISFVLAALCGLLAWFFTRRITQPFRELADMADSVSSGQITEPIAVKGSGELQDIARVFNSVIEGFNDSKKVHEVDKRLLSLKVEERSSQLSERDQALSKASSEAEEARSRLQQMANYDNLTALPNRHLLTEQLDLLLKLNQRSGHTLALLFIDLDNFKRVNDSLGMSAGDQFLVEVSKRLTHTVRDSDLVSRFGSSTDIDVARLGGDEFTVILNQLDSPASAEIVARRILQQLTRPISIAGHELSLHPSIGIAIAPNDGKDVDSLLKAASVAKFHAKQAGNGGVTVYKANLGQAGAERIRLESDLRKAIETNALTLHYQPQVDTHSGSVVGAEALLRWEHPELGPIPPGKFIGIAEDIGLMEKLGDWVLVEACRQVQQFSAQGLKLPKVAINISAEQFSENFVRRVSAVIDASGIQPSQLELGLTEAVMSSNDPGTVNALQVLKESGVYLSVDDFGTGYSPLGYLARYPLDEIKIDRSFLLDAEKTTAGANLVTAIIAMAQRLDLKVLATGVETEAQFHLLTNNGTHLIQGYLFSKPVPAEELRPMLAPWHFVDQVQKLNDSTSAIAEA